MTDARRKLRVALIQGAAYGDPACFDLAKNLAQYGEAIDRTCREYRPQMVVLPELFTTPYFCSAHDVKYFTLAESIPGPTTTWLAELAKAHQVFVTAPIFEKVVDGEYYDSCALIGPDGELCQGQLIGSSLTNLAARKVHIPSVHAFGTSLDEKFWFRPGPGLTIFDTELGRLGCLICYDRSFPEAWRTLVLAGADLVLIPVASHGFRRTLFIAELETLAAANGVWAAACNRVGPERVDELKHMFGGSCLVSPQGEVIAQGSWEESGAVTGEVDLSEVLSARTQMPFLRDRRPDSYRLGA